MPSALAELDCMFQPPVTGAAAAAATIVMRQQVPSALGRVGAALRAVAPNLTDEMRSGWTAVLLPVLRRAGIGTPRRIAAFLGQCSVESAGFRCLVEDLSYSAARLCEVWPSHFPTQEVAEACAKSPEKLANTVYANRLGNGGPETGDGWRFRGRGLIQITGRTAYERFARSAGLSVDQAAAHAATQPGAAASAAWFWSLHGLNGLADSWMLDNLTKAINGGLTGAAERARLCRAALHAMGN